MKQLDRHYPQPLVPEHLTKLTIEKLPFGEVFFVSPGERDDYESPAIFVTAERQLLMARSYAIDAEDAYPSSPLGLIGVMRAPIIDSLNNSVREVYVADLRFIDDHQLVDTEDTTMQNIDQEQFMAWVASIDDSVEFAGFIAPESGDDMDKDIPDGTFYGDAELHPFLKQLRKRGNKVMRKYIERQMKSDTKTTTPAQQGNTPKLEVLVPTAIPVKMPETPRSKKVDLKVRFSE